MKHFKTYPPAASLDSSPLTSLTCHTRRLPVPWMCQPRMRVFLSGIPWRSIYLIPKILFSLSGTEPALPSLPRFPSETCASELQPSPDSWLPGLSDAHLWCRPLWSSAVLSCGVSVRPSNWLCWGGAGGGGAAPGDCFHSSQFNCSCPCPHRRRAPQHL